MTLLSASEHELQSMLRPIAMSSSLLLASACFSDAVPIPEAETSSSGSPSDGTETAVDPDATVGTTVDPDATATATSVDGSTTTGEPVDCMVASNGDYDPSCPEGAPFCVEGICVGCTNPLAEGCEAAGAPGGDVCDASGACVVCNEDDSSACTGLTPACDETTHECVPCTEHADCGPAACNLFTGACVEGMVVTAGMGQMHSTLTAAVAAVVAGGGGTIVVHDGAIFDEAVAVNGSDTVVAFLAEAGATPQWQRTGGLGAPQLRANGGATILIDGIAFRTNASSAEPMLRIDDGARGWVDRSVLAQGAGLGVRVDTNAELVMRNCFALGANNRATLSIESTSTATVHASTLVGNFGTTRALVCDAMSSATVLDSILLTQGSVEEVSCASITADHTASTMGFPGNNGTVGPFDGTWFADPDTGDLHLTPAGAGVFGMLGQWDDGDPTVDIDGDPRAGIGGMPEPAGADVP